MAIEKGLYGMPEGIEGELMGEEMAPMLWSRWQSPQTKTCPS
jgi:hypothetical protein